MKNSDLRFKLNDKLNEQDNLNQTYGCRHSNPDICGTCYVNEICAFTSKDGICKKPPVSWKKRFLLENNKDDKVTEAKPKEENTNVNIQ